MNKSKLFKKIILFVLLALLVLANACQPAAEPDRASGEPPSAADEAGLIGTWAGTLRVLTMEYDLVVHFEQDGEGLSGRVDIPRQGVEGLELANIQAKGGQVSFEMQGDMPTAAFDGQLDGDRLSGDYRQSAFKGKFELQRVEDLATVAQPTPTPEPPKPYREEEVRFQNGEVSLAGTLTLPEGNDPHPAVILVSGSGLQDRDNAHPSLPGYKPFRWLADHLTRAGIAVLRYDDRGVGGSQGGQSGADTTIDYSYDAEAALDFLLEREEIDHRYIGVIGHSEGGYIAALLAARRPDLAFAITMAGYAVPGAEVLQRQVLLGGQAAGLPEEEIRRQLETNRKEIELIVAQDWEGLEEFLYVETLAFYRSLPEDQRIPDDELEQVAREETTRQLASRKGWFYFFLTGDPADELEKVRQPVLALFGGADVQVDPQQNAPAMEAALTKAGNQDFTIQIFPGVDHLFLEAAENGMHDEVSASKGFAPGVQETIAEWIIAHTSGDAE